MSDDIVTEIRTTFEQFKAENDRRLKEIEKHGAATAEQGALVDRLNDRLDGLENRLNRPHIAPAGEPMDERVKGYLNWLRRGIMDAAMQEGTTTEGGYTVPIPMADTIMQGLQAVSIFRQAGARIIPMTRWKMDVPTLTNSTAAILVAEEGGVSEVEPTVGTIQAIAYKYSKLVKVSKELVADSAFDIWGTILAPDFAHAFALAENAAFSTGTGSSQPQGLTYGGTAGVTAVGTTAVTGNEIIDLFYALDYRHQPNAKWMMKSATAKAVRQLKDDTEQYLWAPGLAAAPSTILGQPLIKNDDMPAMATGLKPIVVGNFDYLWIFDRADMSLQRLVELYAGNGQVGFLAEKRFDSHVMLATAFQYITMA